VPDCIVAEDEPLLRAALVAQLAQVAPELRVVAECEDGADALEAIASAQPDVAFLDIRMPGLTGLEVAAAAAQAGYRTQVVFTTAYDQYAVDAFEHGVVDYLLKPIAPERLKATVQRVLARQSPTLPAQQALVELFQQLGGALPRTVAEPLVWLTASVGRDTRLILVEDVAYFRADNKYTVVVTREGEALLRTPLRELLPSLDPAHFKQIHRGTIVNLRAVASVSREDGGRGCLRLKTHPDVLAVSPTFMPLFRAM